jgi:Glycosyltransferase
VKIVHLIIRNEYTDGWAYQENLLPEAHHRLGHDVVVIATTINSLTHTDQESIPNSQYEINGVRVIRLSPKAVLINKRLDIYNNIEKSLEREEPEVIFIHGINFLSLKEVDSYKRKHPKCVVMGDTHADAGNSMQKYRLINKVLLQRGLWKHIIQKHIAMFDVIYYVALQTRQFALEQFSVPGKVMKYLPMGGDVLKEQLNNRYKIRQEVRNRIGVSPEDLLFVTGGRFRTSKKLYELVDAFQMLKYPNAKLLIFGKFEDSVYENKVMNLMKKDSRIQFVGWLSPKQTTEAFLSADLALFSGTQSVIWRNAVACGLPIICRYTFGAEEIDVGGNAIHMFSDEPFSWKQILEHVIETPELLQRMKMNSIEKGIPFFDNDRIAQMVIDDAQEVMQAK